MDRRLALTRLLIIGVAFAGGLHLGAPPVPLPAIQADRTGWLPGTTRTDLEAGRSSDRRVWGRQLELQEQGLRAQLDDLIGKPEPWPAEPAPETTEVFFEDTLLPGFIERAGHQPEAVDCDAYPCVVAFARPLPESEEDQFLEAIRGRNDLFRTYGKERLSWHSEWGIHVDVAGTPWSLMAWGLVPPDASPQIRNQTATRARLALMKLRADHGLVPAEL